MTEVCACWPAGPKNSTKCGKPATHYFSRGIPCVLVQCCEECALVLNDYQSENNILWRIDGGMSEPKDQTFTCHECGSRMTHGIRNDTYIVRLDDGSLAERTGPIPAHWCTGCNEALFSRESFEAMR
jgi:hypothetical protein